MPRLFYQFTFIPLILIFLSHCTHNRDIVKQHESDVGEFPPYTRHLKGLKICLDPGHGGQGHISDYKRGPTGLREAEINLKVALYLREMLEKVEVSVFMTRTDDSYINLADRSKIANENDVDLFISLHHNGITNPETNYTSTWYHGDADESRSSLDLARYIQQGVSNAMQLPKSPSTGLYSDKLVVSSGFGVLRMTTCTAIVCEASFYTNPEEENRLKSDDYLKKEAYGYFLGLARYVEGGFPKGILVNPKQNTVIQKKTPTLTIQVMDGIHERGAWMLKRQQVFSNSIQVKMDNVPIPFRYDPETDLIKVKINKPLSNGIHLVQTDLVNYYGNHSLPKLQQFKVAPPAEKLNLTPWTTTLPYDGKSYVGITVFAHDMDGLPIADGEKIHAKSTNGILVNSDSLSNKGKSYFYLRAPEKPGIAVMESSYGQTKKSIKIRFTDVKHGILQGMVSDGSTEKPISDVKLEVSPKFTAFSDAEGHFYIQTDDEIDDTTDTKLHLTKQGYYPSQHPILIHTNQATVVNPKMFAIADGVFADIVLVIDSQTNTPKTHQLILTLKEMLEHAGAKIYTVNLLTQNTSIEEQIETINQIKDDGYYLQINHTPLNNGKPTVVAAHNRGNQGTETFQKRILEQFNNELFETPTITVQDRDTPVIQQTNKMAMTLEIQTLNYSDTSTTDEAIAIFRGVWLYLKDETEIDKEKLDLFMSYLKDSRE